MPENNLKSTIEKMLQSKHLLSANEILELCKQQGQKYNKTSVYRALEQLVNTDVICRHHFSDDEAKYELREHHHAHLVCTNCGIVTSAECSYQEPKNSNGFVVDHHHITLFGICKSCQS
jgi:Fur family ferric uptake transcriptional regulator